MAESRRGLSDLRREHPVFFWGMLAMLLVLLGATAVIAARVPQYRREQALLDRRMDREEKETRDRILDSRARRSEMAVALLQREMRLKAMQAKGMHLALSIADSTLALRHGAATLRQVRVHIGADSVIRAPDGRTWRFVRGLGERHVREKLVSPRYTLPEWVYLGSGQSVPPEEARAAAGALGRYVLVLDDGTEIYSRPQDGPFAQHVKPAAFMVEEGEMRAIFDAIKDDVPVYIY